jgi:hypothetical protein
MSAGNDARVSLCFTFSDVKAIRLVTHRVAECREFDSLRESARRGDYSLTDRGLPILRKRDLTLITVPKAGHWVHHDASELVTRRMVRYLRRSELAGRSASLSILPSVVAEVVGGFSQARQFACDAFRLAALRPVLPTER